MSGASGGGAAGGGAALVVVAPGVATTVQDAGRAGWAHLGVPRAGAADRSSHRLANRLVGNAEGAAALETSGGLAVRAEGGPLVVAVAGADASLEVDGAAVDAGRAVALAAGTVLRVGAPRRGIRIYVAVAGGIAGPAVLGSRSADALSGIVPVPVAAGARIAIGSPAVGGAAPAVGAVPPIAATAAAPPVADYLALWPGPRSDRFDDATRSRIASSPWTVTPESNRVGVRLAGPAVASHDALESEPLVRGAVQVPQSGGLVVMLADHPTTGGYPVVGVVDEASVDALAQARPGDSVRFRWRRA